MDPNENQLSVALPETLRRQFEQVERRLWRVETAVAVCSILAALAASFLALFVSDRIWETPAWLRWTLFLLGLAGGAGAGWIWLRNWGVRRRDLRALANLVQKTYRRLGDRLLGIVELAHEQRHLANFSPALYHAAIAQVAEEAQKCDFRAAVSARPAKKWSAVAGALGALLVGLVLILPQATANAFWRWMAPASATARYTLVDIEGLPAELIVPQGEAFALAGKVHYRAFWKPIHVRGLIRGQPVFEGTVQNDELRLPAPAQLDEGVLRVEVGDASRSVKILPRYRPSLKELAASIELPDYLHYPTQTETVRNGALLTLEGSRIAFKGKISRPLLAAEMQGGNNTALPLKLLGEEFSSDATPVEGLTQFSLSWRDVLGLTNATPLRLAIQTQKDAPPSPDLPDLPHDAMMLASDVLDIRVVARDDFGVSDLGLMWETFSERPAANASTATEVKVQTASPQEKTAEKVFKWSPSLYHIPVDSVVEIQGYARDFFPERERIRTPVYRIQVLSPEKHAEMLRQQLEGVLAQVEEVTRLQEKIVNDTRELKENSALPESQKAARLGQSHEEQAQNAATLEDLSQRGRQTLQEAIKNPLVSPDAVRDFSRTMQQWQKLSQGAMKEAAQSLKSAQQNADSRPQDLAQALEKEEQALKELEKQQGKNNDNMDQLQAATFAQRLRRIGTIENEAGGQLFDSAAETIGLLPREVPQKFKELEASLVKGQEAVQKEADNLQKEISRFFERTQKTNYNQVSLEMKDARIGEELDTLSGMIRDNVALQSSGSLTNWAGRFKAWGDKLEPASKDASGQGKNASGQAGKDNDLTKQLVALLRLRESELTLREQTRLLDEQKGADYAEQAAKLRSSQQGLSQQLDKIHDATPVASMDQPFAETGQAMAQAETLLAKPQTDAPTDEAQVKSVELLSDLINLINEQAQRPSQGQSQSSPSDASADEMAFLTQMMKDSGQNKAMHSPTGGFNASRGGTGSAASPTTGDVRGRAPGARTVNKAAGMPGSSPAEFRDAMESYFRALEKNGK